MKQSHRRAEQTTRAIINPLIQGGKKITNPSENREQALTQLAALATQLEYAGQYNLAKLSRASIDAMTRRAAYENPAPVATEELATQLEHTIANLAALGINENFLGAFRRGVNTMRAGKLPLLDEIPHPFVCRTCGHIALGNPTKCPTCGAWAETFQKFPPVYWLDALDPFTGRARLRQTPRAVAALLDGLDESQTHKPAPDGGWSIHHILTHMRDAQGVLDFRMNLILEQDNPKLESLAVVEWADKPQAHPPTTREIFDEYLAVREKIIARLENIPLASWWRKGQHLEFGEVTLCNQVSYFASHELTHLPPLERLRSK